MKQRKRPNTRGEWTREDRWAVVLSARDCTAMRAAASVLRQVGQANHEPRAVRQAAVLERIADDSLPDPGDDGLHALAEALDAEEAKGEQPKR